MEERRAQESQGKLWRAQEEPKIVWYCAPQRNYRSLFNVSGISNKHRYHLGSSSLLDL